MVTTSVTVTEPLVHVHLVDALLDNGADVDVLKDARQMLGDDGAVGTEHAMLDLCHLLVAACGELAHGHAHQVVGLGGDKVMNHLMGVVLQDFVDVLGQGLLDGLGKSCQ